MFRRENWEGLKHFRSKYDNEFQLSESILDAAEITTKKKEMDKMCLNAIRMCIVNQETEKVFSYMDLLHFNQSVKLCIKLCEQLKAHELAQKVSKFLQDKENREIFMN